jgi:hypothetical protein
MRLVNTSCACKIYRVAPSGDWLQMARHSSRGSVYLFAPMVDFNVMAEVGETPP